MPPHLDWVQGRFPLDLGAEKWRRGERTLALYPYSGPDSNPGALAEVG